jgi:uncharacterized membrane protein YfcA
VGDAAFLVAAGTLAGAVGSAGGITSLISYPALLAVGIAPLPANVTNSIALVASGLGSTLGSRPELLDQWARLRRWAPLCVIGGTVGAVLLLATPAGIFDWIVPFLVAVASLLLLVQPRVAAWHQSRPRRGTGPVVLLAVTGVSVYSGYFGAGAGVLILAVLLILVDQDLARANAMKNTLLMIADVVPAIVFALAGPVVWTAVLPLAVGAFAGGLVGPVLTRRAPKRLLRIAIAMLGLGLAAWLVSSAAR